MPRTAALSGFVNAHSHAFQRALRGRAAGGDFWAWRDGMLEEADRHTPGTVRELYLRTYREMLAAGYTAVAVAGARRLRNGWHAAVEELCGAARTCDGAAAFQRVTLQRQQTWSDTEAGTA